MRLSSLVLVAVMAVHVPAVLAAQSVGESEFMNSCAACHGADGKGGGPMAGYLSTALPDLTMLSGGNGGVFPVTRVYSVIEGSTQVGAHGNREMPVWGNRFIARGEELANPEFITDEASVFARFRILALTEYLASIQQ